MSGTNSRRIPLLDEDNHPTWTIKMQGYLMSKDMWRTTQTGHTEPTSDEDKSVDQKALGALICGADLSQKKSW
jgi:hypothetical protein